MSDGECYWPSEDQPGVYTLVVPHGCESSWIWNGSVWYRPGLPDVTANTDTLRHHGYLGVNPQATAYTDNASFAAFVMEKLRAVKSPRERERERECVALGYVAELCRRLGLQP